MENHHSRLKRDWVIDIEHVHTQDKMQIDILAKRCHLVIIKFLDVIFICLLLVIQNSCQFLLLYNKKINGNICVSAKFLHVKTFQPIEQLVELVSEFVSLKKEKMCSNSGTSFFEREETLFVWTTFLPSIWISWSLIGAKSTGSYCNKKKHI